MNKLQTYFLLGKILALDAFPGHCEFIIHELQTKEMIWERFVSLADHHYVLQALFPKIKDHKLQQFFPEEILEHLKYIFDLNTARNLEIINQTKKLTTVFLEGGITPLFMKGVGNILDELYNYPGERLLHDIDILVPEERFEDAAALIIKDGYKSNYTYNPSFKNQIKHYPILYKPGEPVYVEIHRLPVKNKFTKYFNTEMVHKTSRNPAAYPDCLVMSDENSIIHNFIHSHIEDEARIYARHSMRNLYDLLLLSNRKNPELVFRDFGHFRRASSGYLDIAYFTFCNTPLHRYKPTVFLHSFRMRYYLNLRYRFIGAVSLLLIRLVWGYLVKPLKAITDKELRMKLITKLRNPEWYKKQADYYKRVLGIRNKTTH